MTDKPLYSGGGPNPDRLGFVPLRHSAGDVPDMAQIYHAAQKLGAQVYEVDSGGYECEIISAAVSERDGAVVYVRSRARELGSHVDIEFRVHVRASQGSDESWAIETYNPYFGCDVRFIRWMDDSAILIYREKHHTYVCRAAVGTPASFVRIEDYWVIHERTLAYWGWGATCVSRMTLPDLGVLESISENEARAAALLPAKHW